MDLKLSAKGIIIGGIIREEKKAIIPKGYDVILPEDHLVVFCKVGSLAYIDQLFSDPKPNLFKGMF